MSTVYDLYDYIISIDMGTTFSGSCYTYVKDNKNIVHVIKWPEQQEEDKYEKTPTACLYDSKGQPVDWGKAAMNHSLDTSNTKLLTQFKLKLHEPAYRQAAVYYLAQIHQYTCAQLIKNIPTIALKNIRYVLTIPATWVTEDNLSMRQIAVDAGIITPTDPDERLSVISEATAASFYCEREYYGESTLKVGQRYLVCDAGGGTVDLATYECTNMYQHCQLALESGGDCGSTLLDRKMELYLKEQVFMGCIEPTDLKLLVDQFVNKIKHHFGDDNKEAINDSSKEVLEDITITTSAPAEMLEVTGPDNDYDEFLEDNGNEDQVSEEEDMDIDEMYDSEDTFDIVDSDEELESASSLTDYVYFTLPRSSINESIHESLSLRDSLITSDNKLQLRISCQDISHHVFDPVVQQVIDLVSKQIRKSYTTIETLFLFGGFGQSPYLYKKLHEEFITNDHVIKRIVVPEHGYRASMRGAIYYGIDCVNIIPAIHHKNQYGEYIAKPVASDIYSALIAIDLDLNDSSAKHTLMELAEFRNHPHIDLVLREKLRYPSQLAASDAYGSFEFDSERFFRDYFASLKRKIHNRYEYIINSMPRYVLTFVEYDTPRTFLSIVEHEVYRDFILKSFLQQLYQHLALYYSVENMDQVRFVISVRPLSADSGSQQKDLLRSQFSTMLNSNPAGFNNEQIPHVISFFDSLMDRYAMLKPVEYVGYIQRLFNEIGSTSKDDKFTRVIIINENIPCQAYYVLMCTQLFDKTDIDASSPQKQEAIHTSNHIAFVFDLSPKRIGTMITYAGQRNLMSKATVSYNPIMPSPFMNSSNRTVIVKSDKQDQFVSLDTFIEFFAKDTDIIHQPQTAKYLKEHVNLLYPDDMHSLSNLIPSYRDLIFWDFDANNLTILKNTLKHYKDEHLSAKYIQDRLIIPWIQHRLAIVIVNHVIEHLTSAQSNLQYSLIFPKDIIETYYCQDDVGVMKKTVWKLFQKTLFDALGRLLLFSDTTVDYQLFYDSHCPRLTAVINDLIHGVYLDNKLPSKYRVAQRQYALHFLGHSLQKNSNNVDYNNPSALHNLITAPRSFLLESNKKGKANEHEVNFEPNNLSLRTLIDHEQVLNESKVTKEFYVLNECTVAIVLYSAKEKIDDGENALLNPLYEKIHRFIVPIKNTHEPIFITYQMQDYSILFTVKQDDYIAEFSYNDLLFLCNCS